MDECDYKCYVPQPTAPSLPEHSYVGPVKIILTRQDEEYFSTILKHSLANFVYFLIGLCFAPICAFMCIVQNDFVIVSHVVFGSLGAQVLLPCGVLMHNNYSAASAPMKPQTRVKDHTYVQFVAMCFLIFSYFILFRLSTECKSSGHGSIGIAFMIICVITLLMGAMRYIATGKSMEWLWGKIHRFLGIVTLILAALTFMSGVMLPRFKETYPPQVKNTIQNVFAAIAITYTTIIIYYPMRKIVEETTAIDLTNLSSGKVIYSRSSKRSSPAVSSTQVKPTMLGAKKGGKDNQKRRRWEEVKIKKIANKKLKRDDETKDKGKGKNRWKLKRKEKGKVTKDEMQKRDTKGKVWLKIGRGNGTKVA